VEKQSVTPILISRLLLAAGLFALAGCQTHLFDRTQPSGDPGSQASLPSGIAIDAPKGYCLDRRSGRRSGVIFASCVRLRGHGAFDPTYGHLLTAAAAGAKNDLSMLAEFLRKGVGRGWLAASGQPADVSIHKMKRSRNALYVELTDRSRPGYLGARGWKAFVNVADQLVVLGVYSGLGPSVSGIDGEELLRSFAQATLAAENAAR
jgi:hypothetical protein